MMRDDIRAGRAFNIIHRASGQKFDIFPALREFHASELQRAKKIALNFPDQQLTLPVATAEEIVLARLDWYAAGRELPERQWADIIGVLSASPELDLGYLSDWAKRLERRNLKRHPGRGAVQRSGFLVAA